MKFLLVSALLIMAVSFSIASMKHAETESVITEIQSTSQNEEGFWCKVRDENDNVVASCFLCNCKELRKAYQEQMAKNKEQEEELAEG